MSKPQTVTNKSEPWKSAQPGLRQAISGAQNLYNQGGFSADPYAGNRVAGFGDASKQGMAGIMAQARGGAPGIDAARSTLTGMMGNDNMYRGMDEVRSNILGSAIPAATAMFAGSGMTNSSTAQDGVGRAATEALAPFEYGAYENGMNRQLAAAGMMPEIEKAGYLPSQMMMGVGGQQDAMRQSQIAAAMQRHYEQQGQRAGNLTGFSDMMQRLGGMGGTQTGQQPGQGSIGGGILGGLGSYGALMGNPLTAGFAIPGGILAGLAGMF